jgi:protein-disulfide isomerase
MNEFTVAGNLSKLFSCPSISQLVFVLFFVTGSVGSANAQTALEKDVAAMRQDLAEMKKELAEIKALIAKSQPQAPPQRETNPTVATISVADKPALGNDTAPVTMVEYSDYQCPFCKRYFDTVYPALKKEYVETGKLKIVFRDFPLAAIHPYARKAHEAAHCAGEQGQYWKMHDTLFQKASDLSLASLRQYAELAGFDTQAFNSSLDSGKYSARIDEETSEGTRIGVRGTPTFIIRPTGSGGTITGKLLVGAQALLQFKALIEDSLKKQ